MPYNRFNRPGGMPGMMPGAMPDMSNISDDQMKASIDMMKQNPEMFKNIMKAQGMNISDEQMNMMTNMMSPEMMRMAQNMQRSGMMPPGAQPQNTNGGAATNPMAGGMPNMQGDQMKNMTDQILNNPEMLRNMMNMMSSDPNSPMMQMLHQQFPNINPTTLSSVMRVMSYLMLAYAYMKKIWSYTVVKILVFFICVYIVASFLK